VRELWDDPPDKEYFNRNQKTFPLIRLIPKGMELLTDLAIYENNVAFFPSIRKYSRWG